MKEYDSTRYLYQLVVRCYECVSLWRLLCERQFPLVINGLSKVKGGYGVVVTVGLGVVVEELCYCRCRGLL